MTSYDVASFLFRFLNCPQCNKEYVFTTDGSGNNTGQDDLILWSTEVGSYFTEIDEYQKVPFPPICKCKACNGIIWSEEGLNTYCKRMENAEAAWKLLNNPLRPDYLFKDDFIALYKNGALSNKQRMLALEQFWLTCCYDYIAEHSYSHDFYNGKEADQWLKEPCFDVFRQSLLELSLNSTSDLLYKAELLRTLGMYDEAKSQLSKTPNGKLKYIARSLISICNKKMPTPVIIPPRKHASYQLKKWVNRRRPGTFRLKALTIEDYY
uniref:hypothetical protein n=1 Tax=Fulvivirga sp. TaxID=1931237 RepID=UPI00404AAF3D